ncbi:MAG TPA: hypothetical protein VL100_07440 [Croceibacterium sp.]|nr:hypothetical protein [Croceibacterium sp.]
MDTLRGNYADRADEADELTTYDTGTGDDGRDDPPSVVDGDERRMQVRAYNHWAGLLESRNFPAIEDLEPASLPDFGPYSVLLDFSAGIENPGIAYLGNKLAHECGAGEGMATLADVPPRSLLSRITDHYMQILANQAPIGFEAEFVNQRGATILYRGILLPYSSDDETIDFIYGVINWKEMADQRTADALLLEIGQALDDSAAREDIAPRKDDTPLTDWADGPAADLGTAAPADEDEDVLDLIDVAEADTIDELDELGELNDAEEDVGETGDEPAPAQPAEIARPRFGSLLNLSYSSTRTDDSDDDGEEIDEHRFPIGVSILPVAEPVAEIHVPEIAPDEMGLGDWLASAREFADEARHGEERTRAALYEAISRAYDFSLAAAREPEAFAELLADAGMPVQERAPMTPVVKLVFGADYDKTRLTEYAAALAHAHRIGLEQGALGEHLTRAEGGLKGVVQAERRLRRADSGRPVEAAGAPRAATVKKLRAVAPQGFDTIPAEGPEFALVMLRRLPGGTVVIVGEVPDDVTLVERAAKKLLG